MKKTVGSEIIKSIKNGLWLEVTYHNEKKEETIFWVAVKKILPDKKILICHMINPGIENSYKESTYIFYKRIKSAKCIQGTYYKSSDDLIQDIDNNYSKYYFLQEESINLNILDYYIEAHREDTTPFQDEYHLIRGMDHEVLKRDKEFKLDDSWFDQLFNFINDKLDVYFKAFFL